MTTNPPLGAPQVALRRDFTSADIVKLFSATFLPLCQALDDAGLTSKKEIAATLRDSVSAEETEAWGALVLALSMVLDRDAAAADIAPRAPNANTDLATGRPTAGALVIIQGGRD